MKYLILCLSVLIATGATSPSDAKPVNRLCWCVKHGPRDGCQRWTCRNKHKPQAAVPKQWRLGDFEDPTGVQ